MIYIFTALYGEAQAFIQYFKLTKDTSNTRFQVFCNEETGVCLTVTGTGAIAAAVAVSCICTERGAGDGDFLLNIGTCAGVAGQQESSINDTGATQSEPTGCFDDNREVRSRTARIWSGELYICNKIIEQATGKTFYPDLLYRHPFKESCVVTGARQLGRNSGSRNDGENGAGSRDARSADKLMSHAAGREDAEVDAEAGRWLYDMEAAAIYQAGAYFFGPHQMIFLKVISDAGEADTVSQKQVERLMEQCREPVAAYVGSLRVIGQTPEQRAGVPGATVSSKLDTAEKAWILKLCEDMHCSKVMRDSIAQHIRYAALAGIDYESAIQKMYDAGKLPCKDKREGKLCFEEFKRRLL